jgi:hypothetical protein
VTTVPIHKTTVTKQTVEYWGQNTDSATPAYRPNARVVSKVYRDPSYEPTVPTRAPTVSGPHTFNIEFGVWKPEAARLIGPAADGNQGDLWNVVGVPWKDNHTEVDLKSAQGEWSPIQVTLINLGGGWTNGGRMGNKSPLLDNYNYPQNNQGGNSEVILHKVPPGKYHLYIYGHGNDPLYYGDYSLRVGTRSFGRKATSNQVDAIENTQWVEGSQYVKFRNVDVAADEDVKIIIHPGGQITKGSDTWSYADAMICGLQLIPVNQSQAGEK